MWSVLAVSVYQIADGISCVYMCLSLKCKSKPDNLHQLYLDGLMLATAREVVPDASLRLMTSLGLLLSRGRRAVRLGQLNISF